MNRLLFALLAFFICSWSLHAADVPVSIPVGVDAVDAYRISTIGQIGVDVYRSTSADPNDIYAYLIDWSYPWENYTATNGLVDYTYIRNVLLDRSGVILTKDTNTNDWFVVLIAINTTNKCEYGVIQSIPFKLIKGINGKYSLPSEVILNSPIQRYGFVGFYAKGITRLVVDFADPSTGEVLDSFDSLLNPEMGNVFPDRAYLEDSWLTNNFAGTISLYCGTGASATVTKYDLKTGWPFPKLSKPRFSATTTEYTACGMPGARLIIECSTNLLTWSAARTIENPTGTTIIVDEKSTANGSCIFHRVRYESKVLPK